MSRRLSAIEIAEGALLADIAVIFQLIATYLPIGSIFFRLLIPIVFTVLVLRRGFYTAIMGLCVALFVVGVITGFGPVISMLLQGGAGLFLGITMKYRVRDIPLILLGTTGAAIFLYAFVLLTDLLLGIPFTILILGLHKAYEAAVSLTGLIALNVGLDDWWKHSALPIVSSLANLGFTYWWALYFVLDWIFLLPAVITVYYITNFFVRLLGYDVRPFPGGHSNKLFNSLLRTLTRQINKRGLAKRGIAQTFIKEVRRHGIGKNT